MNDAIEDSRMKEWRTTVSGKIFGKLEEIAKQAGVLCRVEGPGKMIEVIYFGDKEVYLRKHLRNATVGESGGTIELFAESMDYRKYPWWKEAIDAEGKSVAFMDTPVNVAAQEADIENYGDLFRPSLIMKRYGMTDENNPVRLIDGREITIQSMKSVIDPLVAPDYKLDYYDDLIRLVPQTPEAVESRKARNAAYERALEGLKKAAPLLEEEYKRRFEELAKK